MFRKQEIVDLFVSKDENSYLIYNPFAINVPKLYIIEINEDKFHYNNWIIVYGFEYKAVLIMNARIRENNKFPSILYRR